MMAKAVANETNATFIKMAGSELVQKFIGEGRGSSATSSNWRARRNPPSSSSTR